MFSSSIDFANITQLVKLSGLELGFQQIGITDIDLSAYEKPYLDWIAAQMHGKMDYMEKHGSKRYRPAELIPGTIRVISARMDYLPPENTIQATLNNPTKGYISRYALGRDYHLLMRKRLQKLTERINTQLGDTQFRVFTDSAPVLEKPLAEKAGLGWIGKHTNLINEKAGSWFFLGEIYTNIPLLIDQPATSHCGSCHACLDICPTQAIIAPYQVDARRCVSYLTIELKEAIPVEFRRAMGNRIYGCDDCQLICPWNKFAKVTGEKDFYPRHQLDSATLLELFAWDEKEFARKTAGSAIKRIGHERWLRNIAVALGNTPTSDEVVAALKQKLLTTSALVAEHIHWALDQHQERAS